MKLEPNMYVRTRYGGIKKITNFKPITKYTKYNTLNLDNTLGEFLFTDEELKEIKASHNIIDLIEVGDVIIDKEGHKYPINYEFETDYNNDYESYEITIDDHVTLFFKDGLSIVTKEQFEAIKYEVK